MAASVWGFVKWPAVLGLAGATAYAVLTDPGVTGVSGGNDETDSEKSHNGFPLDAKKLPSRKEAFNALKQGNESNPFDVLIIGGGATGTGCAVDATTRGLRTVMVEQSDFGAGTSSRSTKLVHGGVRYLEKAVFNLDYSQLKLVFEALHERKTMLENAPHLTRALPIMTPCYNWFEVPYYWAGMKAYDLVANVSGLTMSSYLTPRESLRRFPTLAAARSDGLSLKGTIEYFDGQFDDARYALALAQTAALHGAVVLNHTTCKRLLKDRDGRVVGAELRDNLGHVTYRVYAKAVINATGPFTDGVRQMSQPAAKSIITPSAGVHITLPDYYSPENVGMIVPKTRDGRVVFMLPWAGSTIAGTTDAPSDITMAPRAHEDDVRFILQAIEEFLHVKVRREDVQSVWSGIRPLAADPTAANTADAVRDHLVVVEGDGMVTVTGGKWTTYRRMAQDTIDAAVAEAGLTAGRCVTHRLRLLGAQRYHPAAFAELAQEYKLPHRPGYVNIDVAKHLTAAYGDQAGHVTGIAMAEKLSKRLVPWHDLIEAEVAYAARHEMCHTTEDFLARRSRLAFLDVAAARHALPRVVELLAAEHGWGWWRRRRERAAALRFLDTFEA